MTMLVKETVSGTTTYKRCVEAELRSRLFCCLIKTRWVLFGTMIP
jgi:hypothetical protein